MAKAGTLLCVSLNSVSFKNFKTLQKFVSAKNKIVQENFLCSEKKPLYSKCRSSTEQIKQPIFCLSGCKSLSLGKLCIFYSTDRSLLDAGRPIRDISSLNVFLFKCCYTNGRGKNDLWSRDLPPRRNGHTLRKLRLFAHKHR